MIKYSVYDAKLGIYWDSVSIGLLRYYDTPESAISAWESDTPPITIQKQQISFYDQLSNTWCVPPFNKQCRFFVHEVVVDTYEYKLIRHNVDECEKESKAGNKYGRTKSQEGICKQRGILANPLDVNNPFINKLHR
jgi:hypothetical protein